jgi:hypothetical protein
LKSLILLSRRVFGGYALNLFDNGIVSLFKVGNEAIDVKYDDDRDR